MLYKKPINIICAHLKGSKGIGYGGKLPWPTLKEDMKFFRSVTTKTKDPNKINAVIMGRRTWNSLPTGLPLSGRYNMVLSASTDTRFATLRQMILTNRPALQYFSIVHSLEKALDVLMDMDNIESIFIIGGSSVYEEALKIRSVNRVFLTEIDDGTEYPYDTVFPKLPPWFKLVDKVQSTNMEFLTYENMLDLNSEEYQYLDCMQRILSNGERVNDRTGVGTLSLFDENFQFTIHTINPEEEDQKKLLYRIPALTTKNLYFAGIIWELIWFLRGDTDANWLKERNVRIWDGHTSKEYLASMGLPYKEGQLGPGYGHQWISWGKRSNLEGKPYGTSTDDSDKKGINQIQGVIDHLRKSPQSRRAVISAWNVSDLDKMALVPCHILYMFKVSDHGAKRQKLNCKMVLRSNDMFLGAPFNILSCSILTILISRALNMLPGSVAISICDAHVYSNHVDQVRLQLERTPYRFPTMRIGKDIGDWTNMTELVFDDFEFTEYHKWPAIKAPMAI